MKRGSHRKFGRELQQRKAFLKGLLTALVTHGKIRTTEARAKTLRREADKLVTLAKRGTPHAHRLLLGEMSPAAVKRMLGTIAPAMASRQGGYTRIVRLPKRASDASPMAIAEFVA